MSSTTPSALAALGLLFTLAGPALAADHAEAPGTGADAAADIADLFLWENGMGQTVAILTFAGLTPAGGMATYDADVLYGIHFDTDLDNVDDWVIWVRYGQDGMGNWGVKVDNLPGTGAPVMGAVEQVIPAAGGRIWTGLRDDPFFFDLQGFEDTLATGTLGFDSTRDSLAGTNVTALVLEFDTASTFGASTQARVWATTSRF